MPVLNVGNLELVAYSQQITSPALHIKNADGEIYHVAMLPKDGEFYHATKTLIYEESAINTCKNIELSPGFYYIEMRGGAGGRASRCNTGMGAQNIVAEKTSRIIKISEQTTAYIFRGGDGNNSGYVSVHQVPGGGASGTDSMFITGDTVIRSNGAPGTWCIASNMSYVNSMGQPAGAMALGKACFGGGANGDFVNAGGKHYGNGTVLYCASGGGGAPNGIGDNVNSQFNNMYFWGGHNASASGGGAGGDIENLKADSLTTNIASGGSGGANVEYTCGGQTTVSYGGGGGGAACILKDSRYCTETQDISCATNCFDGGAGGSGSTGTSETSYVKIYKIG